MRAMILAAGRGERLRPLTDTLPKPLIEVRGKPVIVHHLEGLAAAGFRHIVVNLSHLGGMIREALGEHIFEWFLRNKRSEWRAYKTTVTQFERDRYLRAL